MRICNVAANKKDQASALDTNGKQFVFAGPHNASSQTSDRQTLQLANFWSWDDSFADSSVLGVACFACLWKRSLCLDEKLWVGSGLSFENCNSFFSPQGTVFDCKCFDHTDWFALPDDAGGDSFMLVGWGRICIMELCCKVFGA